MDNSLDQYYSESFPEMGVANQGDFSMTEYSDASNSTEESSGIVGQCSICGDKATGKHYGASSCDGCKGFFRRSVRKNHNYSCGFNRMCTIDRDKRNQCRFCRLKKCFRAGMKKEAVQNERDKISNRRSSFDEQSNTSVLTMLSLVQAERQSISTNLPSDVPPDGINRMAEMDDVCQSMNDQLLLLVKWAKSLACFGKLSLDDQICLLRSHAGEILILGVVWRTLQSGREDALLLGNNLLISRESSEPDIADVAGHIIDQLFLPMKQLDLEEIEFASFKAIVFFDPNTRFLTESTQRMVRRCRLNTQIDLMNFMNDKQYTSQGRFGELMLLLSDLRSVTQLMVQKVQLAKMMGFTKIDSLLTETLLSTTTDKLININGEMVNISFNLQCKPDDVIGSTNAPLAPPFSNATMGQIPDGFQQQTQPHLTGLILSTRTPPPNMVNFGFDVPLSPQYSSPNSLNHQVTATTHDDTHLSNNTHLNFHYPNGYHSAYNHSQQQYVSSVEGQHIEQITNYHDQGHTICNVGQGQHDEKANLHDASTVLPGVCHITSTSAFTPISEFPGSPLTCPPNSGQPYHVSSHAYQQHTMPLSYQYPDHQQVSHLPTSHQEFQFNFLDPSYLQSMSGHHGAAALSHLSMSDIQQPSIDSGHHSKSLPGSPHIYKQRHQNSMTPNPTHITSQSQNNS